MVDKSTTMAALKVHEMTKNRTRSLDELSAHARAARRRHQPKLTENGSFRSGLRDSHRADGKLRQDGTGNGVALRAVVEKSRLSHQLKRMEQRGLVARRGTASKTTVERLIRVTQISAGSGLKPPGAFMTVWFKRYIGDVSSGRTDGRTRDQSPKRCLPVLPVPQHSGRQRSPRKSPRTRYDSPNRCFKLKSFRCPRS